MPAFCHCCVRLGGEHDDVAAVHVVQVVAQLVDEHAVADLERRHHRRRRDVERLEQERLDESAMPMAATTSTTHSMTVRLRPFLARRARRVPSTTVAESSTAVVAGASPAPFVAVGAWVTGGRRRWCSARRSPVGLHSPILADGGVSNRRGSVRLIAGQQPRRGTRRDRACVRGRDHPRARPEREEQPLEPGRLAHREHHVDRAVLPAASPSRAGSSRPPSRPRARGAA